MSCPVREICVTFPESVELTREQEIALHDLIEEICKGYEAKHPDRVMWAAGYGGRILWREPEEPDFDMSVLAIDCAERERYEGERR